MTKRLIGLAVENFIDILVERPDVIGIACIQGHIHADEILGKFLIGHLDQLH
jgi:hypothetical protein